MSYRPPSTPPQGAWARFLHRKRLERGWSQARAFEELRVGLGFGPRSRAAFTAIDMGKRQPTPKEAIYLRSALGGGPEDADEAPPATPGETAALVTAIGALVEEMRQSRLAQTEWAQAVTEAVATLAELQRDGAPKDGPASSPLSGARR